MSLNDPLANVLSYVLNAEQVGKLNCNVKPASKMIKNVLEILKAQSYVKTYELKEDKRGGTINIELSGNINKCGVIKPRFSVAKDDYEKFEKRFLPAKNLGILIVSTPKGLMTHNDAKAKGHGGKLIAYCY